MCKAECRVIEWLHCRQLMVWCPQVLSATLRCLQRMFKFPLPSLSLHRAAFTQELFSILGRHARRGAAGGTNQELVLTAFKTMTAVIRSSQEEDVSESQLQVGEGWDGYCK